MKIAVNTRLLLKGKLEGIGWFSFESLRRICESHPEHEFIFIFDRPYSSEFIFSDNITPVVIGPPARHPFLFLIWFELSIPYILKKYQVDLFLSPDGYLSLRTKVPSISVIHDLNFEHYPKDLPFLAFKYYKLFFPRFAKKAQRIITVSEYSKQDIINLYQIDSQNIDVAYNGVKEIYYDIGEYQKQITRNEVSNGNPYFIFVGALHPRKNLVGLFSAFDLFKKNNDSDIQLIIVGNKQWWNKPIQLAYENMVHKNAVIFLGHLSPERLNEVVSSSIALTYLSYFEGFGIPIIEAFKAGTAVITSNITSMPEVAGEAAILIDPFNIEEIAQAMHLISHDEELRQKYISLGQKRAKLFSWDTTAKLVWESIWKVIGNRST